MPVCLPTRSQSTIWFRIIRSKQKLKYWDIFSKIIEYHQNSAHFNTEEEKSKLEEKLSRMAFDKTMNQSVVFKSSDLTKYGLTVKQIQDLVFVVPKSASDSCDSLREVISLYFSHQSFQVSFV